MFVARFYNDSSHLAAVVRGKKNTLVQVVYELEDYIFPWDVIEKYARRGFPSPPFTIWGTSLAMEKAAAVIEKKMNFFGVVYSTGEARYYLSRVESPELLRLLEERGCS